MVGAMEQPSESRRPPAMRRNVALLAACQALAMSCSVLMITISALVGHALAEDKSLATLPLAIQFLATMATTAPASFFMKRFGRRLGFSVGAVVGVLGGLVCAAAVWQSSFWLLCAGAWLFGSFTAVAFYYRFAAADAASDAFRSRAISLVMAGGLVAAFLGPQVASWTRDLLPGLEFAGGFLALSLLAGSTLLLAQGLTLGRPDAAERLSAGRPLGAIARQPVFLVAVLCGMIGYGSMNLVMTATPLAMVVAAHPFESAAFVIQWHVVGMYGPSFFTGHLVRRLGLLPVLALGAVLLLLCVVINLSGTTELHFWLALILLGIGWNFLYVGGTTLLTESYQPAEKAKVQALNEFLVFATTATTALTSGALFSQLGWQSVNLAVVGPSLLALAAVLWLALRRSARTA